MKNIFTKIGIIYLIILLCNKCINIYAFDKNSINFESITIDDGLSQSLVEYIYPVSYTHLML